MIPIVIVLGAVVAAFAHWRHAVVLGAVLWPLLLIGHPDLSLVDGPAVAALGAANAAVGGLFGAALRRLARALAAGPAALSGAG